MKASFEQATGIIRQLRKGNERLHADRDLLRAKIVRSANQQEESSALLKRTNVIIKKLMDENDMLRNERQRLVEESMDVLKQRLEDTKELREKIVRTSFLVSFDVIIGLGCGLCRRL